MGIQPLYEFDENWREQIVRMHLEMPRGGRVTGPREGAYGEIYSIELDDSARTRIAAKCPRIKRFGSPAKARAGIEQALHELEKTHRIFMVPWINRFFDVQIIHGWPFILSRYRNGSLEDLIANPLLWSFEDKLATLIQVVRALRAAQERGISAHQDLKPGNIFFDDMSKKGVPKDSKGMHFHVFVGDFGLADAFKDFGKNSGSRPYMAPEQYSSMPFDPEAPAQFDVFALGVIAFECLSDGIHPVGVATADVWPYRPGIGQKWNRESIWREWATKPDKTLPAAGREFHVELRELILAALSWEPEKRPSLARFESKLWDALNRADGRTFDGLKMQVEWLEGLCAGDDEWPHMDERLMLLRQFYSSIQS
jgi:eukaryotic-like serine/threonine-protein kinase